MKDPWSDLGLGVPDGESLLAAFLAEHGGDSAWQPADDGTVDGVVAFGGVDVCPTWPPDEELAEARSRLPGGCGL